jgi:hypothetical protein
MKMGRTHQESSDAATHPVAICSPQLVELIPRPLRIFLAAELSADSKLEQQNVFLVSQWKGVDEAVVRLGPEEEYIRTPRGNKKRKKRPT